MITTREKKGFNKSSSSAACAVLAMIGLSQQAHAQSPPQDMAAATTAATANAEVITSTTSKNGYAESLRPTVRRKASDKNQPYTPIKKPDDQSLVPEIDMFVGESRVFPAPNVGRIAVGNGQIMTAAALDNKEVIVFANSAGTSSLFVWNADGRYQRIKINIVAGDTTRITREIAAFLSNMPHAKASVVGDKVIVEGDNLSDADLAKIDQLEKRYPQLVNFTNRIGWEQMVMMDVKVVEFPKSELRDIGLKWGTVGGATVAGIWSPIRLGTNGPYTVNIPASQNGAPIASPDSTQGVLLPRGLNILSGVNLGINAQLNLLEQNGQASILAEPQLSARNGSEASFLAGGEFPYSVSNLNGTTIIFKPYGIRLNITPKVDHNGVIRAKIDAEVSSIDASVNAVGGPALLTRKTITEFNVRSGQTMVLSGLLQRNASTDIDKIPLLGDIPILGALFRSKRFQNKETELVVFVTPSVVDSQSPGLVDRVSRATDRLEKQLRQQPYLSDPLQPGHAAQDFNKAPVPSAVSPVDTQKPPSAEVKAAIAQASTKPMPASDASAINNATAIPSLEKPVERVTHTSTASTPSSSTAGSTASSSTDATAPARLPNAAILLQVTTDGAIMRSQPDPKGSVVLKLARGALVRQDPRFATSRSSSSSRWQAVTVGATQGWVAGGVLIPVKPEALLQPTGNGDIVHVVRHGYSVRPAERAATVKPAEPVNAGDALSLALPRYQVLLDGLALRVSPDINATTVMQLNNGSVLEALPESQQGYWTAVQVAGRRGWVPAQWLLPVMPREPAPASGQN